jgi:hypothetical protein
MSRFLQELAEQRRTTVDCSNQPRAGLIQVISVNRAKSESALTI